MSILDDNILESTAIDPKKGFPMAYEYGDFGYDWRNPLYFANTEYNIGIKVESEVTMDNVYIPEFGYDEQLRCHILVYAIGREEKLHYEYYKRTKNIVINTSNNRVGIQTAYLYIHEILKNRNVLFLDKKDEQNLLNKLCVEAYKIEQYKKEHDLLYEFKED